MFSFKRSILGLASAVVFSLGSSVASADVVVDLFSEPDPFDQLIDTTANSSGFSLESGPFATVLGGYRDIYISKTFGDSGIASTIQAGAGKLRVSNDDGNTSTAAVTWDGMDGDADINAVAYGSLLYDFSGLNGFTASVLSADLGFDYKIKVWDTDGNTSTLSAQVQFSVVAPPFGCPPIIPCAEGPVEAYYDFSWFNLANGNYSIGGLDFNIQRTGAVDFSSIGALQLVLEDVNTASVDLSLDSVRAVPEPSALALVGLGLLGAAAAGRRRKA